MKARDESVCCGISKMEEESRRRDILSRRVRNSRGDALDEGEGSPVTKEQARDGVSSGTERVIGGGDGGR